MAVRYARNFAGKVILAERTFAGDEIVIRNTFSGSWHFFDDMGSFGDVER